MVAPTVAAILGEDLPQINIVVSEEENHSSTSITVFEKTIPKTLNVSDFLRLFEAVSNNGKFDLLDDSNHLKPYLSISSPPPKI